jgi:hypothetical protein
VAVGGRGGGRWRVAGVAEAGVEPRAAVLAERRGEREREGKRRRRWDDRWAPPFFKKKKR